VAAHRRSFFEARGSARLLLPALLTATAPGLGAVPDPSPTREPVLQAEPADVRTDSGESGIAYEVVWEGSASGPQAALLRESAQLLSLSDRLPASLGALERRAAGDVQRLTAVLRSEGYYDGAVDYRLDAEPTPVQVVLKVSRGDPYRLESFEVLCAPATTCEALPVDPGLLGVEIRRRARAATIVDGERRVTGYLGERGYPLARIVDRRHVVDREAHVIRATVTVDPGPPVGFGPLTIVGLDDVDPAYVRRIRPWRTGQTFDRRLVDDYRKDLLATRLFKSVSIRSADAPDADGNLPLTIEATERELRTVGTGLSWGTDEGFEVSAFWEHRNFFRQNEIVRLDTRVGELEQSLNAFFTKPHFRRRVQTLVANGSIRRVDTDAYKERTITGAIGLERELNRLWDGKLGVTGELTDISENRDDRKLLLFGMPGALIRDSRDDTLDPTRGTRLEMVLTPYLGTGDDQLAFTVTELGGSAYLSLHESDRIILAGRARIGSIVGQSRSDVPPTKRFYAGGGGSIRGYQYQKVGPLDEQNDPLGGRSRLEVGAELRLRVTERIGLVPFVDGGAVYVNPDFTTDEDDTIRWAAGLGFRYYTPIGPLRVDFAFPINGRDRIDDDFQFYVSIGQAY
jgi:translocation and assembly module TamA